ncbi:DUF222 domain-containing protein, partial [Arthrobacter sp. KK5.5]|uniref:DUF222 domain-containing protein n=1 Tax=Arthrobacter sp. KK5.5 TaxID=3373084 RepID=UPI003EE648B4
YRRDVAAEVELMEAQRDWLEAELLAFAPGRTPADLGKKARRVQAKMGPGVLRERVKAAGEKRGVWVEPGTDGMSRMHAELHAVDAVAMMDRIQRIATTLHRVQGEERTMAQLRADVLAALVLGTEDGDTWANIKAEIMVLLPHDVLTGDAGTLLETTLAAMDTTD